MSPANTVQVIGAVPLAESGKLYANPVVPPGGDVLVMVGGVGAIIVNVTT